MLYREIMAVCFQIHTKHINTVCGQNVELLNVTPDGMYSYHWGLQGRGTQESARFCNNKNQNLSLTHFISPFLLTFILSEGQAGQAREPSKKGRGLTNIGNQWSDRPPFCSHFKL